MAFRRAMRFVMDGFVKAVRRLYSFRTPERSYFFLKRRMARSIDSPSWIVTPINAYYLRWDRLYWLEMLISVSLYISVCRRQPVMAERREANLRKVFDESLLTDFVERDDNRLASIGGELL